MNVILVGKRFPPVIVLIYRIMGSGLKISSINSTYQHMWMFRLIHIIGSDKTYAIFNCEIQVYKQQSHYSNKESPYLRNTPHVSSNSRSTAFLAQSPISRCTSMPSFNPASIKKTEIVFIYTMQCQSDDQYSVVIMTADHWDKTCITSRYLTTCSYVTINIQLS